MTTETKRNLAADLALCEAATPGPWSEHTNRHPEIGGQPWGWLNAKGGAQIGTWSGSRNRNYDADNRFIVAAREGWPYAIRRAIEAEAEVARLRTALETAQFHLYREQHMSATDVVDAALEVSEDGAA